MKSSVGFVALGLQPAVFKLPVPDRTLSGDGALGKVCSKCVAIGLRKIRGFSDHTGERPRVEAERERRRTLEQQ